MIIKLFNAVMGVNFDNIIPQITSKINVHIRSQYKFCRAKVKMLKDFSTLSPFYISFRSNWRTTSSNNIEDIFYFKSVQYAQYLNMLIKYTLAFIFAIKDFHHCAGELTF